MPLICGARSQHRGMPVPETPGQSRPTRRPDALSLASVTSTPGRCLGTFLALLQLPVPEEDKSLNRRIGGVPEQIPPVDEPVSLLYGQRKIEIGPPCLGVDTLHHDGNVRLCVAKLGQIKSNLPPVNVDDSGVLGPPINVPLAVLRRPFNLGHRLGRRRNRLRGRLHDGYRGAGGKWGWCRQGLQLRRVLRRSHGSAESKADKREQKKQQNANNFSQDDLPLIYWTKS